MAWFKCSGGGIPASLKSDMNDVLNKKFGTVLQNYPPEDWPGTVNIMGPLEEKNVSGSIVAFSDGADDVPLKSCSVTIPPNLDGVSSVGVVQTGKNLIKPDVYQAASNNLTLGQTDGTSFDTFLKAGTYTISYTTTGDSCYIYRREENDTLNTNMGKRLNATFTLESDGNFRFWLYGDGALLANISNVQIEVGSTATAYTPYVTPTTHTANLGRTIYGGEVDMVNGTGTENYGVIRLDSLPFIKNNNQNNPNGTYFSLDGVVVPFIGWGYGYGGRDTAMSNVLDKGSISAAGSTEPNNTFWWNNASTGWRVIWGEPNGGSSLADFMAFLTANNVVVGGTLSTPEDFTFTPVPIISRLGDNTLWGDGDLSVVYRSSGTQTIITPTLISKTVT